VPRIVVLVPTPTPVTTMPTVTPLNDGNAFSVICVDPAGASVVARVDKDSQGNSGLFTDEPLMAGNELVPKDVRLPIDLSKGYDKLADPNDKLVVTTALEPFALYLCLPPASPHARGRDATART